MNRSLSALHLKNSPLVLVLTQVKFSAVMALDRFVPEIQEQLRHKGFPRFIRGQMQEILLTPNSPPKLSVTDRYEFQDKDERLGIVLTTNYLAVQTNNYGCFKDFQEIFTTALLVVNRVLRVGLLERIGLRYVDLIRPGQNESLSQYLNPGLVGIDPKSVGVKSWTSRFEQTGTTELGTLVTRCTQLPQILPPDLFPSTLKYSIELKPNEMGTLLDFDHFVERSEDFDTKRVVSITGELHNALDLAFRNSVTPYALERWGNS